MGHKENKLTGLDASSILAGLHSAGSVMLSWQGRIVINSLTYLWTLCASGPLARQDGPTDSTVSSLLQGQLTAFLLDFTLPHRRDSMSTWPHGWQGHICIGDAMDTVSLNNHDEPMKSPSK